MSNIGEIYRYNKKKICEIFVEILQGDLTFGKNSFIIKERFWNKKEQPGISLATPPVTLHKPPKRGKEQATVLAVQGFPQKMTRPDKTRR